MDRNIHRQIELDVFKEYSEKIWVYLKNANSKSTTYDSFRNTGYTETSDNPLLVEALVHPLSSNSLIIRELGLLENGAIELIIRKNDVNLFKICHKVKYDENFYSPFKDALGSRASIVKKSFDFYKVILFRTGN